MRGGRIYVVVATIVVFIIVKLRPSVVYIISALTIGNYCAYTRDTPADR